MVLLFHQSLISFRLFVRLNHTSEQPSMPSPLWLDRSFCTTCISDYCSGGSDGNSWPCRIFFSCSEYSQEKLLMTFRQEAQISASYIIHSLSVWITFTIPPSLLIGFRIVSLLIISCEILLFQDLKLRSIFDTYYYSVENYGALYFIFNLNFLIV